MAFSGGRLYVTTEAVGGELIVLDALTGKVEYEVRMGAGACSPVLSPDGKYVYVCNRFAGTVSEVNIAERRIGRSVSVVREPCAAVAQPLGQYLFVANFLPSGRADVNQVAACVSVIDRSTFRHIKDISLANGSNALRDICCSPEGRFVYVSHNLGRFTLPTSQVLQGWMNTSAFSVIETEGLSLVATVVADEPERGAAGVWGIACNGETLFLTHSGTHEVSVIDRLTLHERLTECVDRQALASDLTFLYGIRRRVAVQGNGPRCIGLTSSKLLIPTYFADVLNVIGIPSLTLSTLPLNPYRKETKEQAGERYFNDAAYCYQEWQSCSGCHPGEGRPDGLNWDLMNDGVGNPKNCKSLLFSHVTPPSMISGIRPSAEIAVDAGFRFIQFHELPAEALDTVNAYLRSLRPTPSPFLVNGHLSSKAEAGKKVFERLHCGDCHSGAYYTDGKRYCIGDDVEFTEGWDTPTLREVWRTAPYLFDGRAPTMESVFSTHRHGVDHHLSPADLEALTEYVNSL
jgi:DNA-binding beta-propeller fold protein YncE/mono/diheme cytochrome c family protein